ncbi:MAG: META domain-containing protein [Phycisphaeraceae bacterium]|nr:META domain-containing protein [Phycisphaeraceae bacterium]
MQRKLTTALMLALLNVSGCVKQASNNPAHGSPVAALDRPDGWILERITMDGVAHKALAGVKATLSFDKKDMGGTSGCNGFGGAYRANADGSITFSGIGATQIGCSKPLMEQEDRLMKVLDKVTHYKIDANRLVLSDGTARNKLRYAPYRPKHLSFEGTTWTLKYFTSLNGQTRSAVHAQKKRPITLQIAGDTVSGSGGCNRYRAKINMDRGVDRFPTSGQFNMGSITFTEKSCGRETDRIERRFFKILMQMTHYKIKENRLILSSRTSDQGLQFHGRPAK